MGIVPSLLMVTAIVLELTGLGLLAIGGGVSVVAALWVLALGLILIARIGERTSVLSV